MKYYLHGILTTTGIQLSNNNAIIKALRKLLNKEIIITVEEYKAKRSLAQNRYLHGVVLPIIIEWYKESHGIVLTKDAAKAFIYREILEHKIKIDNILGAEVITFEGKNFSQQTTSEFIESVAKVQEFFDFLDVYIPDPKDKNTLDEFI